MVLSAARHEPLFGPIFKGRGQQTEPNLPDSEEGYHVISTQKLPCWHAQQADKIDDSDNGTDTLDTCLRGGPFAISRSRRRNKLHLETVR